MVIKAIESEILNYFRKNLFSKITINQLSKDIDKDYPNVYNSAVDFAGRGILNVEKVGNSKVLSFSFSPKAIAYLGFIEESYAFKKNIRNIDKILEFEELLSDIILVFGSYAKNKETKNSDIDLLVITNGDVFKKSKLLENKTELMMPPVHVTAISEKDFLEMLLESKPNLGKEAFNNHLIYRNAERYLYLVRRLKK